MKLRLLAIAATAALGASLSGACTTHGEGGRCDPANTTSAGNQDCDTNLICTPASELFLPDSGGANSQADLCCPKDRTTATTDICRLPPVTPGSDASIPDGSTDGNVADVTVDQSSGDGAVDSGSDAAQDAATDAPDGD